MAQGQSLARIATKLGRSEGAIKMQVSLRNLKRPAKKLSTLENPKHVKKRKRAGDVDRDGVAMQRKKRQKITLDSEVSEPTITNVAQHNSPSVNAIHVSSWNVEQVGDWIASNEPFASYCPALRRQFAVEWVDGETLTLITMTDLFNFKIHSFKDRKLMLAMFRELYNN